MTGTPSGSAEEALLAAPGSALEVARRVRSGETSASAVVAGALERIAALNPVLNAFCEVRGTEAQRRAESIDARIAAGQDPGPLAGVPVGLKDCIWEAGVETTNGSRARRGFRPERSAVAVERLEQAGAIVVGRTNQPEFCYRGDCSNDLYGVTANPWDVQRTPGGSSGGSAAAVAAGLCSIALGSDGGGSIRIPSSFCGVVGLKPSWGLVPREPGWPGWYTLNHVGPMACSVEDVALVLQILSGPAFSDPMTIPPLSVDYVAAVDSPGDLTGLRVAVSEDLGYARVDDGVLELFRLAVEQFRALGAETVWSHPSLENPLKTWNTLAFSDDVASEGDLLDSGDVGEDAARLIRIGETFTAGDYARARNAQHAFAAEWHRFMLDFDLVLTPTMECPAFPLGRTAPESTGGVPLTGEDDDWCHLCYAFNLTGQPAITVPMGHVDGLPVGLQIVGPRWADDVVLRAAAAWQRAYPWASPTLAPRQADLPPAVLATLEAAIESGAPVAEVSAHDGLAAGLVVPTRRGPVRLRRVSSPSPGLTQLELDVAQAAPAAATPG